MSVYWSVREGIFCVCWQERLSVVMKMKINGRTRTMQKSVVFVSILSFLLMPMAIDFLLPQHVIGVKYVLLFIPGLIINTMVDPLSLFLNVTLRLSPLFYAGVFSTVLLIVLLWALYFTDSFFLQNIVYVKNIVSIFTFSFYCVIIIRIRKEIWFGRIKALLFCFSYKK